MAINIPIFSFFRRVVWYRKVQGRAARVKSMAAERAEDKS